MASFTDSRLQPFTPYVDQLPVEAMVTVGRQKQQQYEQGIQKIQSQIDNIAGMDVIRDVDKQYLQAKLNTLGGNLRKVAAGDFSNFQLVNSVGGMINHIGKDPNIQNAVSSTVKYRKGVSDMETARKEGKSSPSNEWDFANQANAWLNSPDVKQGLNGGYNPYTNYKKNALDAIKGLTKDETITDDAFTVDAKGNLVIGDANVRRKLSGISPDKIQKALMGTLSPADFKQMEIDGRYNYSNVGGRQFTDAVNSSFSDKMSFYNQQRRVLENAKSSTTSNVEKTRLNEQIASLDKTMGTITSEYRGMAQLINSGNIEAAKAQLHTNNFIDNFSKAFSYTETSQTYENSPFAQMAMQRANKEQDWNKFVIGMKWDREKFQSTSEQDWTKFMLSHGLEKEKLASTIAQKERELAAKTKENGDFGGTPVGIPQESLPRTTLEKMVKDTEATSIQLDQDDETFMRQQGKDREWLDAQKAAWQKSPTGVDPKVANHFNTSEESRRKVDANKIMINEINKEAINRFGDITRFIPNDPAITYTTPEGDRLVYTPEDFVQYNENFRNYLTFNDDPNEPVSVDFERAERELPPTQVNLLRILVSDDPSSQQDRNLVQRVQHYNKTVNEPYKEVVKKINKFTEDEVSKRITISQGAAHSILTPNEAAKSAIGTKLSQFADLAETQKDALPNSPDFDPETLRKIAVSNDVAYSITVTEGTEYQPASYKITATGKNGSEVLKTEFNITPEQKNAVFGNMFEPPSVVQAFRPYQEQIRKMGGYTTALAPGTSNHQNAYLGKTDFPSVQVYGVKANIEQPSPGKYSIRVSAYDPERKQWFDDISYPRNQLVREDQVVPFLIGLNDAAVYELINETTPTAEDLKRIQQASKKPL